MNGKKNLLSILMLTCFALFLSACSERRTAAENRAAQENATATRDDSQSSTIPYDIVGGRIVVELKINNSGPLHFILDTGAPVTTIFESERSVGFDQPIPGFPESEISIFSTHFSGADIDFVVGLQMRIGNVTIENLSVAKWIPKLLVNQLSDEDVPLDGIIGYDLFRFVALEINRNNQTITLHNPNTYTLSDDWSYADLELPDNKPYIWANVRVNAEDDPVALRLHLDLGNAGGLWLKPGDKTGVNLPAGVDLPEERVIGLRFNGEPQIGFAWPIHELEIFDHRLFGLPTRFIQADHSDDPIQFGNIGERELTNFDLLFDYSQKRVAGRPIREFFALDTETLELYSGDFSSEDIPLKISIEARGGLLYFQVSGQNSIPLISESQTDFVFNPMGIAFAFSETESGELDYSNFVFKQNERQYSFSRN